MNIERGGKTIPRRRVPIYIFLDQRNNEYVLKTLDLYLCTVWVSLSRWRITLISNDRTIERQQNEIESVHMKRVSAPGFRIGRYSNSIGVPPLLFVLAFLSKEEVRIIERRRESHRVTRQRITSLYIKHICIGNGPTHSDTSSSYRYIEGGETANVY